MSILNTTRPRNGFTIVELLIVIVVIGILAAVVIVAYNGVQKNATGAVMKETVQSAGTKMKLANASTETYPATLPQDLKTPAGIGLALTTVSSANEFCINVTAPKYTDLQWSVNQTGVLKTGLCSGAVITASIIGDYSTPSTPVSSAVTVESTTGGFKLQTDEAWTQITLSWTPVANAAKYELMTREANGTWYARQISSGAGGWSGGGGTSGELPASTTSLVWTSTTSIPTAAGQVHEYRLRPYIGSTAGEWSTLTLTVPSVATMGTVNNFNVVPDMSWTNHTISWAAPTGMGSPTNVEYELMTQIAGGTWYARQTSTGSGGWSGGGGTSGSLPLTTTSLTWNSSTSRPNAAGEVHEYRVRVKSAVTPSIYGPWSTFTLTGPTSSTLAVIPTFTVSADSSWANITINWTAPASLGSPTNIQYELQTRDPANGTWYARQINTGSGGWAGGGGTTAEIPLTTTSQVWNGTSSKPSGSGLSHEYRIRLKSATNPTFVYGPWNTFVLTRP